MLFGSLRRLLKHRKPETATPPARQRPLLLPVIHWQIALLQDLPAELILQIVAELPVSSVLALALTSRVYHEICFAPLNHRVILSQQHEPLFRARVSAHDPRVPLILHVQVGRVDRIGYANRWNLVDIGDLLSDMPNLRSIETVGGTFLYGWDGIAQLGEHLGSTLLELKATLTMPGTIPPTIYHYAALQTLDLVFVQNRESEILHVPYGLSHGLPSLTHLRLTFIHNFNFTVPPELGRTPEPAAIFPFFAASQFSHLKTFILSAHTRKCGDVRPLQQGEADALAAFLTNHAPTLTVLALPAWTLPPSTRPALGAIPLRLRTLRAGPGLAAELRHDAGLQELHLDYEANSEAVLLDADTLFWTATPAVAEPWPAPCAVRTVRLTLEPRHALRAHWASFPGAFPALEALHIEPARAYLDEMPVHRILDKLRPARFAPRTVVYYDGRDLQKYEEHEGLYYLREERNLPPRSYWDHKRGIR